ncbi:MAG: hypothetical protein HYU56_03685 [Candidatus Aenigmarchaeota archaeon]|nr:hypothetical protein [Candidatus Aenigmarchaeota archaeon]
MKLKKGYWVYVGVLFVLLLSFIGFYLTPSSNKFQSITQVQRITVTFNGMTQDDMVASATNLKFQEYFSRDIKSIKHSMLKEIGIFQWGTLSNGWVVLDVEYSGSSDQLIKELIEILKSRWYTLGAHIPGKGVLL